MTDAEIRAQIAALLVECITLIERLDAETLAHREWLHLFQVARGRAWVAQMEEVSAFFTLPDVRCACGSPELVAARPGTDAETHDLIGMLTRPVPTIGWCAAHA